MPNLTTCPVCAYVRDAAVTVCHECQGIDTSATTREPSAMWYVSCSPYGESVTRTFNKEADARAFAKKIAALTGTYLASWGEEPVHTVATVWEERETVTPLALTLTDAKHETIVRRALESALVSGDPRPRVTFGRTLDNGRPAYNTLVARLGPSGQWSVLVCDYYVAQYLTTEQAVAAIVAARNEGK